MNLDYRHRFLALIALSFAITGFAADRQYAVRGQKELQTATQRKKADVVRVVPHLAVNEEWVSEITFRSDSANVTQLTIEFYDINGLPVNATFFDNFNEQYQAQGFIIPDFQPFEVYAIDFASLDGGARNLQVHVITDETQADYGLEAAYYRFDSGGAKITSVGVPVVAPGQFFALNLDQRFDPYTGNRRFRGFAVSNVDGLPCSCNVTLFNQFGDDLDDLGNPYPQIQIDIPAFGKFLGTVYDLYPDLDTLFGERLGYFFFECDNPASVLGLSFEANTAIATSVPIDFFIQAKAKDGKVTRIRRK